MPVPRRVFGPTLCAEFLAQKTRNHDIVIQRDFAITLETGAVCC
jgi:hypothetical protein